MVLARLRDIGTANFTGDGATGLGCPRSAAITLDSEILRAKCGSAISERYQGIIKLSIEATVETLDPFANIHPGMAGAFVISIPGAVIGEGFPGEGVGIRIVGVVTGTVRRFVRNDLSNATYTLRGISANGISCPIEWSIAGAFDTTSGPADFIRDIASFGFNGTGGSLDEDFCPESVEITEASELLEDSCQGELWPTYVGVSGLNVTITATGKGVKHGFLGGSGATTCLGSKGMIDILVAVGSDSDCAALGSGTSKLSVDRANVTSMVINASSGEITTITLTWTAHGMTGEFTTPSKRAWAVIEGV